MSRARTPSWDMSPVTRPLGGAARRSAVRRSERGELVGHLEPLRREAEERRRAAAGTARRPHALDTLEHAPADEHALQVRRRHVVPERSDVDLAQLRDRERRGREREADVRVRELRAEPRLGRGDELRMVGRQRGLASASRRRRARRPGARPRYAVAIRPSRSRRRLELLDVCERGDVERPRERRRERLTRCDAATPAAGRLRAAPRGARRAREARRRARCGQ